MDNLMFMHLSPETGQARLERRVFYRPRVKKVLWALLCVLFGTSTVLALYSDIAAGNKNVAFVLAGLSLVFLVGGVAMLFRLRKRRPVVIMDPDGLTVVAGSRRMQHVSWDRITDLRIVPAPNMQVLTISHNAGHPHWMEKAAFWRRGGGAPSGFASVTIPSVSVAAPLKKVEAEIRRRV